MSDERDEARPDSKLTGDDPMMKRMEMMVTGGDVRSSGEPVPPSVPPADHSSEQKIVIPASDSEPDASQ